VKFVRISEEQAKKIANTMVQDIRSYIEEHDDEFTAFREGGDMTEKSRLLTQGSNVKTIVETSIK
jgi:hypothetical protein